MEQRILDVFVATAALSILWPLLVAVALAVRLSDGAPVWFSQERVGHGGRPFRIHKFRTMHVGAEARLPELLPLNERDGPAFKLREDPRVTRLGRFLRRWYLDELPQLWNVLRGDMAMVGPRPPLPEEVRRYAPWHHGRLAVRPGLTGPWQVRKEAEMPFDEWVRLELRYIDHWSLWRDVVWMLRTVPVVLKGGGM